jgi:hypothetical protein
MWIWAAFAPGLFVSDHTYRYMLDDGNLQWFAALSLSQDELRQCHLFRFRNLVRQPSPRWLMLVHPGGAWRPAKEGR